MLYLYSCSPDNKVSKFRSVQLYTVVRSKVGLYGQNEQHLVTLLGSRGPLLACPALPSELGQCCSEHCQCSVLVQCSASALVLCTVSAVTRAIYRHSLSIGNKTSAGCLAARCMVQNDPCWCSLQNVLKLYSLIWNFCIIRILSRVAENIIITRAFKNTVIPKQNSVPVICMRNTRRVMVLNGSNWS